MGALPVGIETKGIDDAPYWPTQICWTYKEVWTQPVGQWIWLMQDIAVPASVGYGANFGGLSALLTMINACSGNVAVVNIDNGFCAGYIASLINHIGEA